MRKITKAQESKIRTGLAGIFDIANNRKGALEVIVEDIYIYFDNAIACQEKVSEDTQADIVNLIGVLEHHRDNSFKILGEKNGTK